MDKTPDQLFVEIYEKAWVGEYFGPDGAITLAEKRQAIEVKETEGLSFSNLSTVYASAAEYCQARRVNTPRFVSKLPWHVSGLRYLFKAFAASEQAVKDRSLAQLGPYELQTRANILRRVGKPRKALQCIIESRSRLGMSANMKVLLEIELAEILQKVDPNTSEISQAYLRAESLVDRTEEVTRICFHRSHGRWLKNGRHSSFLAKDEFQAARTIAEKYDIYNQLVMINAEDRDQS